MLRFYTWPSYQHVWLIQSYRLRVLINYTAYATQIRRNPCCNTHILLHNIKPNQNATSKPAAARAHANIPRLWEITITDRAVIIALGSDLLRARACVVFLVLRAPSSSSSSLSIDRRFYRAIVPAITCIVTTALHGPAERDRERES